MNTATYGKIFQHEIGKMDKKTVTPAQCRGARAMLEWSRVQLAEKAGLAERTVIDFERGARMPHANNLAAIQRAFEAAGVEFTNGDAPGVRLKRARPRAGVFEIKDGTFEVRIPIAGKAMPHVLPNEFRSEGEAEAWVDSAEGSATIDQVVAHYVKSRAR